MGKRDVRDGRGSPAGPSGAVEGTHPWLWRHRSHGARQLAMLEATTCTIFVALLIARLVSLYTAGERPRSAPDSQEIAGG
jgi:hypothetical protein